MKYFLRTVSKKLLAIVIIATMILGYIPEIRVGTDEDGHRHVEVEMADSSFAIKANAADGDALQSVATVTTGGSVSDYVDIDSTYTPSGYVKLTTGSGAYVTSPGNYYSYHTSRNGSESNTYVPTQTNDLSWSKNSGNTGVTGTLSDKAVSDYKGCGENGALCAKVNSKVLKVHALSDINVTFDFSSVLTIDASSGQGSIMEGVYTLKTTSDAPTIAQIKAGTVRSNTSLTDLSKTVSGTGNVSESIQEGEYLYIYFYSFFNNQSSSDVDATNYTYTASVTSFEITPVTQNYSLTVGNTDCADNLVGGGKITVNGTAVTIPSGGTAAGLTNVLSGTSVVLSVNTVPSGYQHIGWRVNGTDVFEKTYEFALNADMTVYALFIPQVTVTMGSSGYSNASYSYKTYSGTTVNTADQYIARNSAATAYYKTLNEAFSANSVVVLLGNIVLNGDFTIPSGKTLSIQRDWTDPATQDLQQLAESTGISIFAKATINGTVSVQGNLVASGVQGTNDGINGRATGGAGQFIVNGTVNIASGGTLRAYGMVTGSGQINVASGGNVYELMEVRDMRSVYVLADVATGGAFLFNSYFVKTNEVATTYSKGASLIASYYVSISGIKSSGNITIIGSSSSLFNIQSGSMTKSFSSASPYNNKMIFRAENGSNIQSGNFSITVKASGFSRTIDTSNFELPINYCFAIEVMNGGSMTLNYDHKLLPGALVDVKEGGTLTIASGKKLVFYRANDYRFSGVNTTNPGFSAAGYPTAFTKPSGLSYASNTAANVGSAKLNVDGTLNVAGGLYVTNQLTGLTTYSNGYHTLTGTGTISFSGTQSNGTIKEWRQSDSSTVDSDTVSYVPMKGITVYDTESDDGQTNYNSLSSGTWYGYINDSSVYVWSKSAPVYLSYDANGGTGDAPQTTRKPSGTEQTAASNTFTAPTGKRFSSWNTKADGSGTAYAIGAVITITSNTILYAQWEDNGFTVTWKNDDGTTLEIDENVEYGTTPSYDGETPTKAATAQYTYAFAGWTPAIAAVTADVVYTATYTSTVRKYQITFVHEDGTVLQSGELEYGTVPVYNGAAPEKAATENGYYTFAGWTPEIASVTGAETYTTVFEYHDYTYGEPEWTWAADGSSATVRFVAVEDANVVKEPAVTVSSEVTIQATCTEKGTTTYMASVLFNGTTYTSTLVLQDIPALGHTAGEAVRENNVDPTCEEAGHYELVVYCTVCGEELSRETVIVEALGHDYEAVVTDPTCTERGYTTHTCSRCGDTYVDSYVDALGHDWSEVTYTWASDYTSVTASRTCAHDHAHDETETVEAAYSVKTPATCEGEGAGLWTSAEFENEAFAVQTKEVTIPALGHTPGEAVLENNVEPTCTEEGHYDLVVYCTVCGKELSRETVTVEALGHAYEAVVTAPTCTEQGYTTYTCTRCGHSYVGDYVDALGHAWSEVVYTWAADNKSVTASRTCANDHAHDETETVEATYSVKTPAGCETDGVGLWTSAEFKNEAFAVQTKEVAIPALGHEWAFAGLTWTGNDNDGYTGAAAGYICGRDGTHTAELDTDFTKESSDATCTEPGTVTYTAEISADRSLDQQSHSESKTVTGAALGHDWAFTEFVWYNSDTTLEVLASAVFTCRNDKDHTQSIDAVVTSEVTVEPGCETDGTRTYTATVTFEGKTYTDTKTEAIEALGHDWSEVTYTWSSDNKSVTASRTCANDHAHDEMETVETTYTVKTPAACEVSGVGIYTSAEFKNQAFKAQTKTVEIPAAGHTPGETVVENNVDPTCEEEGHYDLVTYCTVCGKELSRETVTVESLGHDYEAVVTAPTCTEQGYTTYTCKRCGHSYVDDYVDALGHGYELTGWSWTDDFSKAEATFTCKNDQAHTQNINAEVTSEVTVAPGCETAGTRTYTATVTFEGKTYTDTKTEAIEALGHTPGEAVRENNVDPTCTEEGHYDLVTYCTVCGEELNRTTVTVEALGHNYESTVTAPTCTEQGCTTHTCSRCGDSYKDSYTDALGHDWDEGEVTKAPTCTEAGVRTFTCTRCGEKKTEAIAALGHAYGAPKYTWAEDNSEATAKMVCEHDEAHVVEETVKTTSETTAPTCTEAGFTVYTAVFTNEAFEPQTKRVEGEAALGHNWGEAVFTWTGLTAATATRTCKNDTTHTETVDCAITSKVTTEPTAAADGVRTYTATATFNDGTMSTDTKTEAIPKYGFVWTRLAGSDRYETMEMVSKTAFEAGSCKTLIVAAGTSFPDALAGAALAGIYESPILLTKSAQLSPAAEREIERLASLEGCKVYILGGEGTVAPEVPEAIRALANVTDVERISGTNRELTAIEVFKEGIGAWGDTVILATGYSFADVLSISPYAYASKTPILLGKKDGSLSDDVKELFESNAFKKVLIIGGTGSVSEETEEYLKKDLGLLVLRLEGANRYETSAEILKWETGLLQDASFQPEVLLTMEGMGVATGSSFPDALGSVSLLGKTKSPLLLVSDSNSTNRETTQKNIDELIHPYVKTMKRGYIFGGEGSVSAEIETMLNETVQ